MKAFRREYSSRNSSSSLSLETGEAKYGHPKLECFVSEVASVLGLHVQALAFVMSSGVFRDCGIAASFLAIS